MGNTTEYVSLCYGLPFYRTALFSNEKDMHGLLYMARTTDSVIRPSDPHVTHMAEEYLVQQHIHVVHVCYWSHEDHLVGMNFLNELISCKSYWSSLAVLFFFCQNLHFKCRHKMSSNCHYFAIATPTYIRRGGNSKTLLSLGYCFAITLFLARLRFCFTSGHLVA